MDETGDMEQYAMEKNAQESNTLPEIFRNAKDKFPNAFVETKTIDGKKVTALYPVDGKDGKSIIFDIADLGTFQTEIVLSDGGKLYEEIGGVEKLPDHIDWNGVAFSIGNRIKEEKAGQNGNGLGFDENGKFSFSPSLNNGSERVSLGYLSAVRLDTSKPEVNDSLLKAIVESDAIGKGVEAKRNASTMS